MRQAAIPWLAILLVVSLGANWAYARWLSPLNRRVQPQTSAFQTMYAGTPAEQAFLAQGDEISYYRIARNVAEGRGYSQSRADQAPEPTAYRAPLFPLFLAGVYGVLGPAPSYGVYANHLLIALLIPLAFWVGSQLHSPRCGLLASALIAIWPHGLYFGNFLVTEPLFAVLQLLVFGLLLRLDAHPSPKLAGAAGLVSGAAILTRTNFALVAALVGLWMLWFHRRRMPWRMALAFAGATALVLLPWMLRNLLVMGALIPGTTGSGVVFAGAHSPQTIASYPGGWLEPGGTAAEALLNVSEVQRDTLFWQMGLATLEQLSPAMLFRLYAWKVVRLWAPVQRLVADEVCALCNVPATILAAILFLLSLVGLWLHRAKASIVLLAIAFMTGTTLTAIIFWGASRFRMPLEPILWTFAAYALLSVLDIRRRGVRNRNALHADGDSNL